MKRIILGGVAVSAIVLGIAGVALASTVGRGSAPVPAPGDTPAVGAVAATGSTVLPVAYNGIGGWRRGAVRPPVIYIGESNVFVRTPHWAHWTAASATTRGTLWVDTCTPTCSAGHYRQYPAVVTLGGVASHRGVAYFSRLGLSYTHGSPRHYTYRWGTLHGATMPGWNGGPTS